MFGCVHTDSISASFMFNYVEKLTKDDAVSPESPLLMPPHFI